MSDNTDAGRTIAILMPGDMGSGVGRALKAGGYRTVTCLAGRSAHSRALAEAAGVEDMPSLAALVAEADMILSILPPAAAISQAQAVATEIAAGRARPVYVDCNAISPETARWAADILGEAGAPFIDAGIVGLAPGKAAPPRFYVSGADTGPMLALDGCGIVVKPVGPDPGAASAVKMVYAGLTKGTWTLHAALLLTARRLGVLDPILAEFEDSQKPALDAMRARLPFIPADSARWIGEMEEIAATLGAAGLPAGFHEGAADIFRLLAETPFAEETRQSMDRSRTLEQALAVYDETLARLEQGENGGR